MKKTGIELIAKERQEQIEKHGRTIESDVEINQSEELRIAAIALLNIEEPDEITEGRSINEFPMSWNDETCVKLASKTYKERLIVSAALLAAEIDRVTAQ